MNDELLIKFLLKETTEEEVFVVNEWLKLTEANKTHFLQFKEIWLASKALNTNTNLNVELAWIKFKNKTSNTKQTPIRQFKPKYLWFKIAAMLVIAITTFTIYSILAPQSYKHIYANLKVQFQTLPDGSELTLNKLSHISYAANFKSNRNISLDSGDVFFNVTKDKNKPFVIKIDKVLVEVVGTSFNIKHLNKKTEVIVETGIVKVRLRNQEVKLYKGEKIEIENANTPLLKTQTTDKLYNYYRSKLFLANNTPLPKLIATLNEAYKSNVRLDEAIQNETITTTLKYQSLEYNLQKICETLDLKIVRNQNEILLSKIK